MDFFLVKRDHSVGWIRSGAGKGGGLLGMRAWWPSPGTQRLVGCGRAMDSSAPWWSVKHTLVIFDEVHSILKDHQSTWWNLWIIFHSILWWFQPWHLECICVRGNCETSTVAEDLNHSNQYFTIAWYIPCRFKAWMGKWGSNQYRV